MPSAICHPSFLRASVTVGGHAHKDQRPDSVRTIPELVEFNASHNSNHRFCLQVNKNANSTEISFLQLKQAVLRCSAWLKAHLPDFEPPKLGEDGRVARGPPIALFMESDVGIFIYLLSLLSIGTPVLLLSARLSPVAIHKLLDETGTTSVLSSGRLLRTANEVLQVTKSAQAPVHSIFVAISYQAFLHAEHTSPQNNLLENIASPYHYTDVKDRNVLILHSSGTTGLPKALYHAHELLMRFVGCHDLDPGSESNGLNASTLPLYHGFGLVAPILSLSIGLAVCFPHSSSIPTGPSTVEIVHTLNASCLMTVPSILEDICNMPHGEGIEALRPLQFVAFGGGAVKHVVGETLVAAGVKLVNTFGTTETGPLAPVFVPTVDYDWRYFRLRKDIDFQLQKLPFLDGEVQKFQLTANLVESDECFKLQDLLVRNPNSLGLEFAPVGRNDDLIVLATGEKILPRVLENLLSESPLVKTAIAFGEGRFEMGVIIEPSSPIFPDQYEDYKSSLWPIILQAADQMDAHTRVSSKSAIVIVPAGKIIPRTDKGSIARKDLYRVFESEISRAYEDLETDISDPAVPKLHLDHLERDLKNMVQSHLNWKIPPEQWTCDDDFFELGIDSLQALRLRRLLLFSLPGDDNGNGVPNSEWLSRDFVYQNPSINQIVKALREHEFQLMNLQDEIDRYVEIYSIRAAEKGSIILLTGSTGSLGSHLLAQWAASDEVDEIICLIRPKLDAISDPWERQLRTLQEKKLDISQYGWSKIRIIQTNSAAAYLGLSDPNYKDLCGKITHIFHNAWPVDFNWKLPSFKAQFQTVHNLLKLARDTHATRPIIKTKLILVSSIAVVGQYGVVHGGRVVPEIPIHDEKNTTPIGYGAAKMVCERIIENAAKNFGDEIQASYVRIGQMSGSLVTGYWNTAEHFPALLKSSQRIGKLPRLEGTFSWISVDTAAKVLSEILLTNEPTGLVLHLENPVRQSWQDALATLAQELNLPISSSLTLKQWLYEISSAGEVVPGDNPAINLVEFFEAEFERMSSGKVIMATDRARALSPTLQSLEEIPKNVVAKYIQYWKSAKFLS